MPRRRIHFGLIVRVCVLLLIGAVITVAAAWAPAVWWFSQSSDWIGTPRTPTEEQVRWWRSTISLPAYPTPTGAREPDAIAIGFDRVDLHADSARELVTASRWRSGLPMRSMMHYTWSISPGSAGALADTYESEKWNTKFALVRHRGPIVLPVVPRWIGFVVDTLFYAALAAAILAAWRWMIRRGRLKRGLCPVCKYPIGSSAVCSECGEELV